MSVPTQRREAFNGTWNELKTRVEMTASALTTYEDTVPIDNDPSLGRGRMWTEGHDVPDHRQTDLETLGQALACAFRLSDTSTKSDWYLDD
jgi:hypothetical protein